MKHQCIIFVGRNVVGYVFFLRFPSKYLCCVSSACLSMMLMQHITSRSELLGNIFGSMPKIFLWKSTKVQEHKRIGCQLMDRQYQSCQQYLIHSVMSAVFASQNHVLVSLYDFTSNPLNIFSTPPAGPGLMLSSRSPRGRWWRWPRWRVKLWRKPWFLAQNGNRIGHWLTRLQR